LKRCKKKRDGNLEASKHQMGGDEGVIRERDAGRCAHERRSDQP
jgi:hypothetical protein